MISIIGLRFFSVYGPFGRPDMAYYAFTKAIKEKELLSLNNNGLNMFRDMTFIDDIIQGILGRLIISLIQRKNRNEIFNLGNDTPIKTSYLLKN